MRNVLIGGLITLVVTLLVQVFVIPWVQRRTRRRERWEREVTELLNLMEVDLPTRLETLRLLWINLLAAHLVVDVHGKGVIDIERFRLEILEPLQVKAIEAYESTHAVISHASLLQRRVSRFLPGDGEWATVMKMLLTAMNTHLLELDPRRLNTPEKPTSKQFAEDHLRFKVHGQAAVAAIMIVSDPMKPPGAGRWRRLYRWPLERMRLVKPRRTRAIPTVDQIVAK